MAPKQLAKFVRRVSGGLDVSGAVSSILEAIASSTANSTQGTQRKPLQQQTTALRLAGSPETGPGWCM